ncbi:oligopeptide/dipeptide ABC transporter ATP-binding protein [Clostridium sp. Cult3]|uniref:oligopeptide/dipeptide ABC transporter ATP-binding protein n=1 Tax=Clostridium sp. Cult3 TaxID=2079004 RepID=UPI003FA45EF7|nr:ABC transporter ATP-binding protein [Clostridium sp. Cult3]
MAKDTTDKKVLVRIENLKKYFPLKKKSIFDREQLYVRANDDVTLDIYEGETLGLVGESGCGKSTLGRTLLQLYDQTDGRTIYYGRDIDEFPPKYVSEILENLVGRRKDLYELRKEQEAAQATYDSLPEGDEKYRALDKLRQIEKDARLLYLDLAQLIGGFMVAEDLEPVSKILLKEHSYAVEARKLRNKIEEDTVKLEGNISLLEEQGKSKNDIEKATEKDRIGIKNNEKELAEIENKLQAVNEEIQEMLDKYRDHPDFEKHEKYKDKGINLARLTTEEMRVLRKDLQLIFQDPYSSLNPRLTVGQIISEGLYAHKMFAKGDRNIQDHILATMDECGLASYFVHRYPHQFSGGQRQRIGIARSIALRPKFIVADEAVSALDVSIQSQIINLLLDLKERENLTYLFISHDLSVIKYISDRVGVMYLGSIVELAETEELYSHPLHPYTEALLSAIPTTDVDSKWEMKPLEGDVPSPVNPPSGCKFHTRCKYATDICSIVVPEWEEARPGHFVACHHKLNGEDKE